MCECVHVYDVVCVRGERERKEKKIELKLIN